jgi:hypothetical protein
MPLLPPLVSPEELRDALADERVRVFDATVFLRRAVEGGPYTVESGRTSYARAHLVDPVTGRFRPPADLAAAFREGGVREDQPVVAYCGGGISATVDLFALSLTGRDGRPYDGSLTEWSADPGLPLVTG